MSLLVQFFDCCVSRALASPLAAVLCEAVNRFTNSICSVVARAAEDLSGGRAGELAVVVGDLAVDDTEVDACGELCGLGVGGVVEDGGGVEDGDVGEVAWAEDAAIGEALALSGERGDLADGHF